MIVPIGSRTSLSRLSIQKKDTTFCRKNLCDKPRTLGSIVFKTIIYIKLPEDSNIEFFFIYLEYVICFHTIAGFASSWGRSNLDVVEIEMGHVEPVMTGLTAGNLVVFWPRCLSAKSPGVARVAWKCAYRRDS